MGTRSTHANSSFFCFSIHKMRDIGYKYKHPVSELCLWSNKKSQGKWGSLLLPSWWYQGKVSCAKTGQAGGAFWDRPNQPGPRKGLSLFAGRGEAVRTLEVGMLPLTIVLGNTATWSLCTTVAEWIWEREVSHHLLAAPLWRCLLHLFGASSSCSVKKILDDGYRKGVLR